MIKHLNLIGLLTALFIIILTFTAEASPKSTQINFISLDSTQHYHVKGKLYLPENGTGPYPAVVEVHGTTGPDIRYDFYRESLLKAGFATFEVDFKSGIYTSAIDRPQLDVFVPLAFAALKELRKVSFIDPDRIGIMGYSLGAGVTVRTAMEVNRQKWMGNENGFAAFLGFYPPNLGYVMKLLVKSGGGLTGSPMIIFYGTDDCYRAGIDCPKFKELLATKYGFDVTTVEYPGVHHGFDRNSSPVSSYDKFAIDGRTYMEWSESAANDARKRAVEFLRQNLGPNK